MHIERSRQFGASLFRAFGDKRRLRQHIPDQLKQFIVVNLHLRAGPLALLDGSLLPLAKLTEPADRPQNGPDPAYYTQLWVLHLNLLRKSLPVKHLQRALAIRPAEMQGTSRRQWEPDAKDAGFSGVPRRQWEPQPKDALLCIIMHYYAGFRPQNVHKGCRNASQRARSRRLCMLQIFVPSLRPR